MKLIPSREAVDFLAQSAPRPWIHRMLRWMALDGELDTYSSSGRSVPFTTAFGMLLDLKRESGGKEGDDLDRYIVENHGKELADKLRSSDSHERVSGEHYVWTADDEPLAVDYGFYLYADDIDWNAGVISASWINHRDVSEGLFFTNEDLFGSDFRDADFDVRLEGLSFRRNQIEMLSPALELKPMVGVKAARSQRVGRPLRWDWEGAMAYVASQAQHPDGLPTGPGAQARIEEMIAGWFVSSAGDAPAESQVRERAAKIIGMLEVG